MSFVKDLKEVLKEESPITCGEKAVVLTACAVVIGRIVGTAIGDLILMIRK